MQFFTIKKVLAAVSTSIFLFDKWEHTALMRSIIFCNSDTVTRKVWFSIRDSDDAAIPLGSILFNLDLLPNETMQMPDRALISGDFIIAYSDVPGKVSFVADIEIVNTKE